MAIMNRGVMLRNLGRMEEAVAASTSPSSPIAEWWRRNIVRS